MRVIDEILKHLVGEWIGGPALAVACGFAFMYWCFHYAAKELRARRMLGAGLCLLLGIIGLVGTLLIRWRTVDLIVGAGIATALYLIVIYVPDRT